MKRTCTMALVAVSLASPSVVAAASTLKVGPGKPFAKPCDAIAAAQPNDVVEVDAQTYTDTCAITVDGLTVRGVGGRPKIDLSGMKPALSKGIYVVQANDVRLENLELTGAQLSAADGENGAAVRVEASGLVISGCFLHDNQNGVLGSSSAPGSTLTIEYTELARNGMGDACNAGGCTHNVYANDFAKVVFQHNWSHSIATDTPDKGHLLKSRAEATFVLYNRLSGEDGFDSYEIDLPNGGLGVVVGNVVQKGTKSGNSILVNYGEEGLSRADKRLFVVNNTFVNDLAKGTFISVANGATLTANNNLFVGAGTPASTGALSADNLAGVDPLFVDAAQLDFRLKSGSPAIDKGVDPGSADTFSLTPVFEYVHPVQRTARASDGKLDVGAFEYGTVVSDGGVGPDADGGAGGSSGGGASSSGGPSSSGAAGAGSSGGAGSADDSGCNAGGRGAGWSVGALLALAAILRARARARG